MSVRWDVKSLGELLATFSEASATTGTTRLRPAGFADAQSVVLSFGNLELSRNHSCSAQRWLATTPTEFAHRDFHVAADSELTIVSNRRLVGLPPRGASGLGTGGLGLSRFGLSRSARCRPPTRPSGSPRLRPKTVRLASTPHNRRRPGPRVSPCWPGTISRRSPGKTNSLPPALGRCAGALKPGARRFPCKTISATIRCSPVGRGPPTRMPGWNRPACLSWR